MRLAASRGVLVEEVVLFMIMVEGGAFSSIVGLESVITLPARTTSDGALHSADNTSHTLRDIDTQSVFRPHVGSLPRHSRAFPCFADVSFHFSLEGRIQNLFHSRLNNVLADDS